MVPAFQMEKSCLNHIQMIWGCWSELKLRFKIKRNQKIDPGLWEIVMGIVSDLVTCYQHNVQINQKRQVCFWLN